MKLYYIKRTVINQSHPDVAELTIGVPKKECIEETDGIEEQLEGGENFNVEIVRQEQSEFER